MKRFQNRLMINFTMISIVPLMLVGFFSYRLAVSAIEKKVNNTLMSSLTHIGKNIEFKLDKFDRFLEFLKTDGTVQKALRYEDIRKNAVDIYDSGKYVNSCFSSFFYQDDDIDHGILLSKFDGIYYKYKADALDSDIRMLRQAEWYARIEDGNGANVWGGWTDRYYRNYMEYNDAGSENKMLVIGSAMRDTKFMRDLDFLGIALVFINPEIFSDIDESVDIYPDTETLILDGNNEIIAGNAGFRSIAGDMLNSSESLFSGSEGNFEIANEEGKWVFIWFKLDQYGWKVMHVIPYAYYVKETAYIGLLTAAAALVCLILLYFISYALSRSISNPVLNLAKMMEQVGNNNFDVVARTRREDEIGIIYKCFNGMVGDIKKLFREVEEKERKKRKAEIRQLQYQINPHFLYNTLGSIRLSAIMQGNDGIARMLQVLIRLLRNTIRQAGELVSVREELRNTQDYIFIHQIRFSNKIGIRIDVDEDIMDMTIPCMLFQPILENCIMHGLSEKLNGAADDAEIRIKGYPKGEDLCFEIFDNGKGMTGGQIGQLFREEASDDTEDSVAHIGIKNIHDRIRLQFGDAYGIQITSEKERWTIVEVVVPGVKGGAGA